MKAAAAFAIGLWTGAVVVAAVGIFYFRVSQSGQRGQSQSGREKLESRIQLLQQDEAKSQAEEARLKQTIAELQSNLDARILAENRRQLRSARREPEPEASASAWIQDAVTKSDIEALPRLEQAALQGNLQALDALGAMAERDGGESLTRVWSSPGLNDVTRRRATFLLASTSELNPHAEELLLGIFTASDDPQLREAALAGILAADSPTRWSKLVGQRHPPDFAMRLRLVDGWRSVVTNESVLAQLDRVRDRLVQRLSPVDEAPPATQ